MASTIGRRYAARTRVGRAVLAALSIAALLLLSACAGPRIDGSSDEAFRASVAKVRESVPESDRTRFDKALLAISMDGAVVRALSGASREAVQRQMRERLAGKTAADVFAEADVMEAQAKAALSGADS
jgi:hypothetical protein